MKTFRVKLLCRLFEIKIRLLVPAVEFRSYVQQIIYFNTYLNQIQVIKLLLFSEQYCFEEYTHVQYKI